MDSFAFLKQHMYPVMELPGEEVTAAKVPEETPADTEAADREEKPLMATVMASGEESRKMILVL